MVIVSNEVVVSVSSVVFTVVVGIASLVVKVVSEVITAVELCVDMLSIVVSGDCGVFELFVVVAVVVVVKLVVDCDVSPGCVVVVVSSVDPLCNVVVASVVSFPAGDDEATFTFSVVCVT